LTDLSPTSRAEDAVAEGAPGAGAAAEERPVGLTYQGRPRTAGFRFSVVDGVAIAVCAAAMVHFRAVLGPYVGLFAFALGHFFLFCNVFRVRRNYELAWTGVCLANLSAWFLLGEPFQAASDWLWPLAVQTPFTALAIGAEVRSPRYHGICARRWNPALDAYLAGEDG
jgi:hypothetical protein